MYHSKLITYYYKVCQLDYVQADLYDFVTLNIANVGFQMNIIKLTHSIMLVLRN